MEEMLLHIKTFFDFIGMLPMLLKTHCSVTNSLSVIAPCLYPDPGPRAILVIAPTHPSEWAIFSKIILLRISIINMPSP